MRSQVGFVKTGVHGWTRHRSSYSNERAVASSRKPQRRLIERGLGFHDNEEEEDHETPVCVNLMKSVHHAGSHNARKHNQQRRS
jgi:hypothetical protein